MNSMWVVQQGPVIPKLPAGYRWLTLLRDSRLHGGDSLDLQVARVLRQTTWMAKDEDDRALDLLASAANEDGFVFLGEQTLGSLASFCWCMQALKERGVDLRRVRLAVDPRTFPGLDDPYALASILDGSLPVAEVVEDAARARLVLLGLETSCGTWQTGRFQDWFHLANRMVELLPDAAGRDYLDRQLLNATTTKAKCAVFVVCPILTGSPPEYGMFELPLWWRMCWLSQLRAVLPNECPWMSTPPLETAVSGTPRLRTSEVRRTNVGARIASGSAALIGRADGLRWYGARCFDMSTGKWTIGG